MDNYNSLNDFLFYKYMCEESNERQQRTFLEAIGVSIRGDFKVLNQTIASETIMSKKCILDFLSETRDSFINVELQQSRTADFNERIVYYMSKIAKLKRGKVYTEFKDVILVSIVNFKMNNLPNYKHEYMFINTKNLSDIFTNKIRLMVIELEKFKKVKKDLDNKEHQYLMFFDKETDHKKRKELGKMDEGLRASVKKIEEALQDDNAVRVYHKLEYEKMLRENEKIRIKIEREKGRKEGMEIANIKVATKLKKSGVPVEDIAKLTDLTREVIEKL